MAILASFYMLCKLGVTHTAHGRNDRARSTKEDETRRNASGSPAVYAPTPALVDDCYMTTSTISRHDEEFSIISDSLSANRVYPYPAYADMGSHTRSNWLYIHRADHL
jgi:hypothetical protein